MDSIFELGLWTGVLVVVAVAGFRALTTGWFRR